MAKNKGKSEGGSGGKRGHSNMNHWSHTDEVKNDSRHIRRKDDKEHSLEGESEYLIEDGLNTKFNHQ